MTQEVFNRHEYKYMIDFITARRMAADLKNYTEHDSNGSSGSYRVTSLYYDTIDGYFYQQTLDDEDFRQKVRLRVYGNANLKSTAFIEIKQRHFGYVNKRRLRLPLSHAYDLLARRAGSYPGDTQVLGEVQFLSRFFDLAPKVMVSYQRQAFVSRDDDDLRITFDTDLRCSQRDLRLEDRGQGILFVPSDQAILEIKTSKPVPVWLARLISEHCCRKEKLSKFKISLAPDVSESLEKGAV